MNRFRDWSNRISFFTADRTFSSRNQRSLIPRTNDRTPFQNHELDLRLERSHFLFTDDRAFFSFRNQRSQISRRTDCTPCQNYESLSRLKRSPFLLQVISFSSFRNQRSLISRRNDHDPCQNHELLSRLKRSGSCHAELF